MKEDGEKKEGEGRKEGHYKVILMKEGLYIIYKEEDGR